MIIHGYQTQVNIYLHILEVNQIIIEVLVEEMYLMLTILDLNYFLRVVPEYY